MTIRIGNNGHGDLTAPALQVHSVVNAQSSPGSQSIAGAVGESPTPLSNLALNACYRAFGFRTRRGALKAEIGIGDRYGGFSALI